MAAIKLLSLSHLTFVCDIVMKGTGVGLLGGGNSLRKGISHKPTSDSENA